MPATDLVCVTFEGDARLSVLQVLSIDRLLDHADVNSYIIVLNGADNLALEAFIRERTAPLVSKELQAKLRFVESPDVLGGHADIGRRNQQLLKLKIAERVDSEFYLLLDAKNHFIHRSSIADFFEGPLAKTVRSRPSPALLDYARASLDVFGADPSMVDTALPTITPYVMKTDEVLDLMHRVEQQCGSPFPEAFDTALRAATEFFLYYAHLLSNDRPMPYVDAEPMVTTLFTKWPEDSDLVMSLITGAATGTTPLFGLHRLRLPQLLADQREAIEKMWRAELLRDNEDAGWFMEPV